MIALGRWSFHVCNHCSHKRDSKEKSDITYPTHPQQEKNSPYEPRSVLSDRESTNTLILNLTTYKPVCNHPLFVRSHQSIAFASSNLNRLITAKRYSLTFCRSERLGTTCRVGEKNTQTFEA